MKRSEIWSARTGRPWFSLWIVEHCPTATTRLATAWRVCWNVHEGLCSVSWRLWTLNVSWVFSDTQRVFSVQSSQTFAKYVRLSLLSQMQQKQHVWRASKKTIIWDQKVANDAICILEQYFRRQFGHGSFFFNVPDTLLATWFILPGGFPINSKPDPRYPSTIQWHQNDARPALSNSWSPLKIYKILSRWSKNHESLMNHLKISCYS